MKNNLFFVCLSILALSLLFACKEPHEDKIPGCSISSPKSNREFNDKEDITVTINAHSDNGTIVSVKLYIDNVICCDKVSPPYKFTIPAGRIEIGSHTLKAIAFVAHGDPLESDVVPILVKSILGESPNMVSFTNGELPSSWVLDGWELESGEGYDDSYSLKTTNETASIFTTKTAEGGIDAIEFYAKSAERGYLGLYIDNVYMNSWALSNSWQKYTLYVKDGFHSFRWDSRNTDILLDAIHFRKKNELLLGQPYQGGIIAYVDNTGEHGFIAASEDQSAGIGWGVEPWYSVYGEDFIGKEHNSTIEIAETMGEGDYAAWLCYSLELNDYDDWHLPSKSELRIMWEHRNIIGGFKVNGNYWSSSTDNFSHPYYVNFKRGDGFIWEDMNKECRVRAIRYF